MTLVITGCFVVILPSVYGVVIDCAYRRDFFGYSSLPQYACVVTSMSSENPTIVDDIRGEVTDHTLLLNNYVPLMNNSDVLGFSVYRCPVAPTSVVNCPISSKSLPANIGNFFPNLQILKWVGNDLETITADALKTLPNLKSLELSGNLLTTIDGNLFRYTPKIVFVDLADNLIQHIGSEVFDGLNMLFHVALRNNTCIDSTFSGQDRIKSLSLQIPFLCPYTATSAPSPTTTSVPLTTIEEQCLARCSLNEEVDELKVRVDHLSLLNAKFDEKFARQQQIFKTMQKLLMTFLN